MTTFNQKSLNDFNKSIQKFVTEVVPNDLIAFQKKIAMEALSRIVMKTPVDTGRARGNWQIGIGSPKTRELKVEDKSGRETLEKGRTALAKMGIYEIVYISNNVTYILYLENGSSKQSPSGMVAVTFEELQAMFQ